MPIEVPRIDDRSYREILNEALARIRVHNPEWTNFNESDPGVTLLELFAFMTESLLYRSNQIPERNRRKFLTLLGVPLLPAGCARGIVTFTNARGRLESFTLGDDLEVLAGQVPFRTQQALDVLPVEAKVYYKAPLSPEREAEVRALYTQLYGGIEEGQPLGFYQTTPLEPPVDAASIGHVDLGADTVDGALWVALLARPGEDPEEVRPVIAGRVLNLGILPALDAEGRALYPVGSGVDDPRPGLVFELATDRRDERTGVPVFQRLEAQPEGDLLQEPGVVSLRLPDRDGLRVWEVTEPLEQGTGSLPPSLEETEEEGRVVTWLRIRLPQREAGSGLRARIGWVGINAATVVQQAKVPSETVGRGTGEAHQTFDLVHGNVIPESVQVEVDGEAWSYIDDLLAAGSEVSVVAKGASPGSIAAAQKPARVFTVDPEAGRIAFGDGLRGARPPRDALIRVRYAYGGGIQGNVGIGAINKGPGLPSGVQVINPLPTWGGGDAESVDEAEQKIPRAFRHKDRLVSKEDFVEIAARTPGVEIGRLEVLPTFHPDLPEIQTPGVVTVLAIPRHDRVQPDAPRPDRLFLDAICRHLEPRRLVTTEVHVRGPRYRPVSVSVGIEAAAGSAFPVVRDRVARALKRFLSPLVGGREGTGWPRDKSVIAKELWAEAARVDGVAYVNELFLFNEAGASVEEIPLRGLELPRLQEVVVAQGEAEPLGGPADSDESPGGGLFPVPVPPDAC